VCVIVSEKLLEALALTITWTPGCTAAYLIVTGAWDGERVRAHGTVYCRSVGERALNVPNKSEALQRPIKESVLKYQQIYVVFCLIQMQTGIVRCMPVQLPIRLLSRHSEELDGSEI
jgi:hypothetical protein